MLSGKIFFYGEKDDKKTFTLNYNLNIFSTSNHQN